MMTLTRPGCPTIVLRITDGTHRMHRTFDDFGQALASAEAFAGAGFAVTVCSAAGKSLMRYPPREARVPMAPRPAPPPQFSRA